MTARAGSVIGAAALVLTLVTGCSDAGDPGTGAGASVAPSSPPGEALTPTRAPASPPVDDTSVASALVALEAEFGARVGVVAVDTGDERTVTHRADERFGYASTLKALVAALVLQREGAAGLDRVVTWSADEVVSHSPVLAEHVDTGLPLGAVAEAAVRASDNTALNVLVAELGGPGAVGDALAANGDEVTSVDRLEPALNEVAPGELRDTSTPAALAADLRAFALGDALEPAARERLLEWLSGNATGDALIRAGAPEGWTVADKSGGAGGLRHDIAIVARPGAAPIVLAVLTSRDDPDAAYDDALVARAASVVLTALA